MKRLDLTGAVYGKLTVLEKSPARQRYWLCRCQCGAVKEIFSGSLQRGSTVSCGCYGKEVTRIANTTHGKAKTAVWNVWREMVSRTKNPSHKNAKFYSERNIDVDPDWLEFENFYRDMGDKPYGMWLERKDNNKGYCKDNCKWETPSRQCSNRRSGSNKSGRVGGYFDSESNKWRASIVVDKITRDLGRFSSFEAACTAITKLEIEVLGFSREVGYINNG